MDNPFPSFPSFPFQAFQALLSKMAVVMDGAAPTGPLADPFFLALESGAFSWSDLVEESAFVSKALEVLKTLGEGETTDERVVEWWTDEYKTTERLANYEVPDLTLRSDITDNFPVVLAPLEPTADGRERFRVLYDEERLEEWASTRAESNDENAEYAEWVQTRLVFALNQYSYKYKVESVGGLAADHVLIFAMAHPSAPRRGRAAIPTLRSFPVSWDRDPADHTRHLIKPHMKRLREGEDEPNAVISQLLEKLLECDDCTVEYMPIGAAPTYIMTVIIPSAEPPATALPPPAPLRDHAREPVPAKIATPAVAVPAVAAAVAMGGAGAGTIVRSVPAGPRAIDVMKANRLAWDRDALDTRIHRIKRRAGDTAHIIAELQKCGNCTVEVTPKDRIYMCVVTLR